MNWFRGGAVATGWLEGGGGKGTLLLGSSGSLVSSASLQAVQHQIKTLTNKQHPMTPPVNPITGLYTDKKQTNIKSVWLLIHQKHVRFLQEAFLRFLKKILLLINS